MKKILTVFLTLLALSSLCAAGCKGESESRTQDDTVTEQNIPEGTSDKNGEETEPAPAPRMPDMRHDDNKPCPRPLPRPHHHKK